MTPDAIARSGLPGAELVSRGLLDLTSGELSPEALLVLMASPRLSRLGITVPPDTRAQKPWEHALYSRLEELFGDEAYSRYNSMIRRIVSFSRALEREQSARSTSAADPL